MFFIKNLLAKCGYGWIPTIDDGLFIKQWNKYSEKYRIVVPAKRLKLLRPSAVPKF